MYFVIGIYHNIYNNFLASYFWKQTVKKFSSIHNFCDENKSLLNARALSFNTLTAVGNIGEITMVVFGDSLLISWTLRIKRSKTFANIMWATAPNTFEVIDPHMQPNLGVANAFVGINILNKVGGYSMVANVMQLYVFGITIPHNQ